MLWHFRPFHDFVVASVRVLARPWPHTQADTDMHDLHITVPNVRYQPFTVRGGPHRSNEGSEWARTLAFMRRSHIMSSATAVIYWYMRTGITYAIDSLRRLDVVRSRTRRLRD